MKFLYFFAACWVFVFSLGQAAAQESANTAADAADLLRKIRELTPTGAQLRSAHAMADGRIALHFAVDQPDDARLFVKNVEASPHFEKPVLVDLKAAQGDIAGPHVGSMNFARKRIGQSNPRSDAKAAPTTIKETVAICRTPGLLHYVSRFKPLVPEGVVVDNVRVHGKQLMTVRGVAKSGMEASQLIRNVQSSPEFRNARLLHMNKTIAGHIPGYSFDIDITLPAACDS